MDEEGDPLFTVDIVRDFMISNGGKVTNHALVTHFKTFLNDPRRKVANRQKFKSFVNTLAAVKLDISGEKLLVLKKKYRDNAPAAGASSVATPQVVPTKRAKRQDAELSADAATAIPSDAEPAEAMEVVQEEEEEPAMPIGAEPALLGEAEPALPVATEPTVIIKNKEGEEESPVAPPSDSGDSLQDASMSEQVSIASSVADSLPVDAPSDVETTQSDCSNAIDESESAAVADADSAVAPSVGDGFSTPAPAQRSVKAEDGSTTDDSLAMSVKDRARHLNRIESLTDVQKSAVKPTPGGTRLNESSRKTEDESQTSVTITLDKTARSWMVLAANADYHPMAKMLQLEPHLVSSRDLTTGYTALHWAAKHGKGEVVKLLCGTPGMPVNARSYGGYTALHLAAIHGHEDVIEMLVHAYGADPKIRDYGGKKAKQHLRNSASSRAQQLLQTARISGSQGYGTTPQRGRATTSARARGANSAVRNSWVASHSATPSPTQSPARTDSRKGSEPTPCSAAPRTDRKGSEPCLHSERRSSSASRKSVSPRLRRKASLPSDRDSMLMPPPQGNAPVRRKKSQSGDNKEQRKSQDGVVLRAGSEPELRPSSTFV